MKTKTSLPPSLRRPPQALDELLPGNLRQKPARTKLGSAKLLEQVAERSPLDVGERLERVGKRIRECDVNTAFLAHDRFVATTTGSRKRKVSARAISLASRA